MISLTALAVGGVAASCARVRVAATPAQRGAASQDLVVLLHGMGRTPLAMRTMARSLEGAGFRVLNVGYDGYRRTIPEIEASVARRIAAERAARPAARVHVVAHSLGSIVARRLLADGHLAGTSRVVLLAPPNRGAVRARQMAPYVGWLQRPMRELTPESPLLAALPPTVPEGVEVVVVAADRDGKVRVEETRWDGARRVVVHGVHTFLMQRPDVIRATARFLQTGTFDGLRGTVAVYDDRPKASR